MGVFDEHPIHDAAHPIHGLSRAVGACKVGAATGTGPWAALDGLLQAADRRGGQALQLRDILLTDGIVGREIRQPV